MMKQRDHRLEMAAPFMGHFCVEAKEKDDKTVDIMP